MSVGSSLWVEGRGRGVVVLNGCADMGWRRIEEMVWCWVGVGRKWFEVKRNVSVTVATR